ncbi:MAG: hypothetical protein ACI857_001056 [Arenicella sp.]|jgi:uncharacterized protein YndB with AHSA1/START domain
MKFYLIILIISLGIIGNSCSISKTIESLEPSCKNCKAEKLKANHWKVYTDIDIDAPIEKVWEVLTDFEKMPNWSTSGLQGVEGDFVNGGKISAKFKPDAEKEKMNEYEHNIIIDGYSFGWEGDAFSMGMTDRHFYKLIALTDKKTRLIQIDEPNSGMTWMFGKTVSKIMAIGYNKFNNELKTQVEGN